MALNENSKIKCIFTLFIVIAFILLIGEFNKTIIEGMCNDCKIYPKVGEGNSNSLFDSKFADCTQLDLSGSDSSFVFCPWINNPSEPANVICSSNNSVWGTYETSYCCMDNNTMYMNNYLTDICGTSNVSNIPQYGLIFDVSLIGSNVASGTAGSTDLYKFTAITTPYTDIIPLDNLFDNRFTYNTTDLPSDLSLSQNSSGSLNQYINCSGGFSDINTDSFGSIPSTCYQYYQNVGFDNYTIGQGVAFCVNNAQYCDISNVASDCSNSLLLPNYAGTGVSNEWFRISQTQQSGDQSYSGVSFELTDGIQSQMQSAVSQLISAFTQQINSLSSSMGAGSGLQFPNLGPTQYLDVGACDNNSPYLYNSGCDSSLGYLQQYTCYPSLTGTFSDCGPPAYEPKPQFY